MSWSLKKTTGSTLGAHRGVAVHDEIPDEREVYAFLQAAVKVVRGDQVLQGDVAGQRVETALLDPHHVGRNLLREEPGGHTSCSVDHPLLGSAVLQHSGAFPGRRRWLVFRKVGPSDRERRRP
jgi:hypothetical protein